MKEKIFYKNSSGFKLCGILSNPIFPKKEKVVILCHGFTTDKNSITNLILEKILNESEISTFRFDFTGHGESEGELGNITISKAVDDVLTSIQFLKRLDYSKIGLIGSSFGGLASILASSRSKDIQVMALKSPVSDLYELFVLQAGEHLIEKWKNEGYIDYTSVNGDNFKLDYSLLKEAEEINVYKIASEIKIPVLIVHGDHDESVPLNQSKNLASLLKNCKLEIIKGADHRYSDSKHFNKMISLISDFIIKNF
ncbi:alpha/beta fold hydrolase [SCandidatus Aminicenantes bacterium Aminicenantia_JdfR_composite]|jgi:hypothetical protein|nr:alpha/beta fold hydrolase [SCandidatus Aminicenantes bacterium Aminicenantia_JdfR_composite]MCP2606528.1 alpha/beta fold hydrolase [Candidatus Aminicenantes bacterium AC-708-I09]